MMVWRSLFLFLEWVLLHGTHLVQLKYFLPGKRLLDVFLSLGASIWLHLPVNVPRFFGSLVKHFELSWRHVEIMFARHLC